MQTRRQMPFGMLARPIARRVEQRRRAADYCRREGIASSMYYCWSKEFLEAGKKRLAGDTARRDFRRTGASEDLIRRRSTFSRPERRHCDWSGRCIRLGR
jgi:hypothetical protein